jgi:hypothetical protein
LPREITRLLALRSSSTSLLASVSPFMGRAPPCL